MSLAPGTRLGSYEIGALLGAGGMGEVYRAIDTHLKRAVAIKVLPETLVADTERLARFQREAEVLASLNHPHIAQIHGLEKTTDRIGLVMELVEGPTLADGRQRPLIQTPFDESSGAFSPDGHWIAYVSNETGRLEVSLIDYPGLTRKIPVSRNGGVEPVWAKNGQELFYREGDALVAVPITKGTTPSIGQPRVLFRGVFQRGAFGMPSYDVASDGKRFLAVGGDALAHTATRVNYVLGWTSQLKN